MERLTRERTFIEESLVASKEIRNYIYRYFDNLSDEEQTKEPKEEICLFQICRRTIEKGVDELLKYKDLEEKLGIPLDILTSILNSRIEIWTINGNNIISYCIDGFKNGMFYAEDYCRGCRMDDILFNPSEYGIVWFISSEEAKKKLEEMKNE